MRYFLAAVIPVGFVIVVFSVLAILTSMAEGWSSGAQESLAAVVVWWARYWWMIAMVLASACLVAAVVHDAHAPVKRKNT